MNVGSEAGFAPFYEGELLFRATLVEAPGGGVMGVYSRSDDAPIKTGHFQSGIKALKKP